MKIDPSRYYIFDCNGKMIGNPFGYKTHSLAQAQVNRKGYTVYSQIWHAFSDAKQKNPQHTLIHAIKAGGAFA
jgi:hypothetical protein